MAVAAGVKGREEYLMVVAEFLRAAVRIRRK
jgi:hypothetical protein